MIPTVSFKDSDALREELHNHPMWHRRCGVEQAFLDELTQLTRKYGLEIKADTRSEYGETYPDHMLKVPYVGTEGRYQGGSFGIEFSPASKDDLLPCSASERDAYRAAKALRKEEDEVIDKLSRKISNAHYDAWDKGMKEMMDRQLAEYSKKPKPKFVSCACGEKFNTGAKLAKHQSDTGHGK